MAEQPPSRAPLGVPREGCPSVRQHHAAARAGERYIPSYKRAEREKSYRDLLRLDVLHCDYCNPRCSTCGTRAASQPVRKAGEDRG